MGLRASPEQFSALIEFMESHGDLAKPQSGAQGRVRAERLWMELANILNSMGSGVQRSADKWKKVNFYIGLVRLEDKDQKKALTIRCHATGTGGGPSSGLTLSALEERVIAILGPTAVEGQAGIEEQGFDIPPPPTESAIRPQSPLIVHHEDAHATSPVNVEHYEEIIYTIPPESLHNATPAARTTSPQEQHSYIFQPITSTSRRNAAPTRRDESSPQPPTPLPPSTPAPPPRTRSAQPQRASTPPAQRATTPLSSISSPRRRVTRPVRQRRTLTPFDRASSEFVAVETRRLKLEEMRERNHHNSEIERLRLENERLRLESERLQQNAQRIDIDRELITLLRVIINNVPSWLSK